MSTSLSAFPISIASLSTFLSNVADYERDQLVHLRDTVSVLFLLYFVDMQSKQDYLDFIYFFLFLTIFIIMQYSNLLTIIHLRGLNNYQHIVCYMISEVKNLILRDCAKAISPLFVCLFCFCFYLVCLFFYYYFLKFYLYF